MKQVKLAHPPVLQQSPVVTANSRTTVPNMIVPKEPEPRDDNQLPVTTPKELEQMKLVKRPPAKPRWETKKVQRMQSLHRRSPNV